MSESMVILSTKVCRAACVAVLEITEDKRAKWEKQFRANVKPVVYHTGHLWWKQERKRERYGEEISYDLARDSYYSAVCHKILAVRRVLALCVPSSETVMLTLSDYRWIEDGFTPQPKLEG